MLCFVFIRIIIKIDHLYLLSISLLHTLNAFVIIITALCNLFDLFSIYIVAITFNLSFIIKQAICVTFKPKFSFYYVCFYVSLAFLCSLSSSIKYAYVFALSPTNSFIIFPPNSSLKRPITFLFLPVGSSPLSS